MTVQPPVASPVPPSANMELGAYVSKAWNLTTENLMLFVVGYLVLALIIMVSSITVVGPLIIGGPLMFGFVRVVQKRYKGEPAEFGDIFQGFKSFNKGLITMLLLFAIGIVVAIPVLLLTLVLIFLPCIGHILATLIDIAVGLFMGAWLYFAFYIAALSDVDPVDAIKAGIKFAQANLMPMILLSFVAGLITMAGVVACGIGVFFSVPLGVAIAVVAYNEFYLPNARAA